MLLSELVGGVSGVLGMGGGTIYVLIIIIGYPQSFDIIDAAGTSIVIMLMSMSALWVGMISTTPEVHDRTISPSSRAV